MPKQYEMPGDAQPRAVVQRSEQPDGHWWLALHSSALNDLISCALKESPTIAEAEAALDAARSEADIARGGSQAFMNGDAGLERARVNPASFGFAGFPAQTVSRYTVGASVNYDLDLFGGKRRERESADARMEVEIYQREAAHLAIAGNIVLQAIEIASLREQIQAGEAILSDDRNLLALVDRAIIAGAAARIDAVRVQTQLAQDQATLPNLRNLLARARHALALLVGRPPGSWAAPDFKLSEFSQPKELPIAIPSQLVRERPDILAAESTLHSATAQIGVRTAQLYPNVSILANFAQTSLSPEKLFSYTASGWSMGAQLTAPIWNGGTLRAKVRQAEAEARGADARYRATILKAFGEVADALQEIKNFDEDVGLQENARRLAQESLEMTQRNYELGSGKLSDVLDAQRQLNNARRAYALSTGQKLRGLARLYAATTTTGTLIDLGLKR